MKLAILAFLQGREAVAHAMEMAEDAYAEACADLKERAENMEHAESNATSAPDAQKRGSTFEPKSTHQ